MWTSSPWPTPRASIPKPFTAQAACHTPLGLSQGATVHATISIRARATGTPSPFDYFPTNIQSQNGFCLGLSQHPSHAPPGIPAGRIPIFKPYFESEAISLTLAWTIYRRQTGAVALRVASGSDPIISPDHALTPFRALITRWVSRSTIPVIHANMFNAALHPPFPEGGPQ